MSERHGPFSVTEFWDPAVKKWRTLRKSDQRRAARAAEEALLMVQADAEPAVEPFETPGAPTQEQLEQLAAALKN